MHPRRAPTNRHRSTSTAMKTYAQTIELRADGVEEYVRLHAAVWPEVLSSLRAVGVLQMKIWTSGRRAFMYMETTDAFDPDVDFPRHMAMSEKCVEWGALTRTFQSPVEEAKEGEWWCRMEECFDMRAQLSAREEDASRAPVT